MLLDWFHLFHPAYYLSYLYAKYRWEPVLIVLTQSRSTARWATQPIRLGLPGWEGRLAATIHGCDPAGDHPFRRIG